MGIEQTSDIPSEESRERRVIREHIESYLGKKWNMRKEAKEWKKASDEVRFLRRLFPDIYDEIVESIRRRRGDEYE